MTVGELIEKLQSFNRLYYDIKFEDDEGYPIEIVEIETDMGKLIIKTRET